LALVLFAQRPEGLLAVDRFHPIALEIVVAAVERLADGGDLFEVSGKGILDDVLGARPLVAARSFSFLAVSGVTCTSIPPLYGCGD